MNNSARICRSSAESVITRPQSSTAISCTSLPTRLHRGSWWNPCVAVSQRMPVMKPQHAWEQRAVGDAVGAAAKRLVVVAGLAAEMQLLLGAVRRRRQGRRRRLWQEAAAQGAGDAAGAAGTGLQPRLHGVWAAIREQTICRAICRVDKTVRERGSHGGCSTLACSYGDGCRHQSAV